MIIGVTGSYAAGKDHVSHLLSSYGFHEIDVDALGHRVLEEKKTEVIRLFGNAILRPDNTINRQALGRIVFSRQAELVRLENLLHPRMKELVTEAIGAAQNGSCVINAALLFPMGLAAMTDMIILVRAPFCVRYRRARSRDGISFKKFLHRCRRQRKIGPKYGPGNVDIHTIWNTGNLMHLKHHLDTLILRNAPSVKKDGTP